jgi:hypothetical protein
MVCLKKLALQAHYAIVIGKIDDSDKQNSEKYLVPIIFCPATAKNE